MHKLNRKRGDTVEPMSPVWQEPPLDLANCRNLSEPATGASEFFVRKLLLLIHSINTLGRQSGGSRIEGAAISNQGHCVLVKFLCVQSILYTPYLKGIQAIGSHLYTAFKEIGKEVLLT